MVFRHRFLRCVFLELFTGWLLVLGSFTFAQDGPSLQTLSQWPMERVELTDGRHRNGLIRHADRLSVELVEVRRPPGRPMFLLVHWIPRSQVARIERLPTADRERLQTILSRFRNRTAIAQAARDAIALTRRSTESGISLHYRGSWFTVDSTADEPVTRESIARVEQVFAGYRTLLPPRISPRQPLRLVLVRSLDAYLAHQRRSQHEVKNPAYFDPARNEIVVGGDLAEFASRLRKTEHHHERLLAIQKEQEAKLRTQLQSLNEAARSQGTDEETVRQLTAAMRRQWQQLTESQQQKIRQARRANDRLFDEQFRVLYHEAFHAYLENFVYDRDRYHVPRWLNEGWAQIFENAQLDAGSLRLDAPNTNALVALQHDLAGDTPLTLTTLLSAPDKQFVVGHDDTARRSSRLYLYAWGLAYYVTFRQSAIPREALDRYLQRNVGATDRIARFETFVGMPIDEFETEWRAALRAM